MPAFTTIALGVAAAASTAQAVSGAARAAKAKRALENFQRQELKNVTKGMTVSTLGAELQTQEAQRRFATGVDALRSGGVRGLVGGLGVMEQQQQQMQQQISADLDQQQQQIEQARAQEEANIRAMQEQRESSQIAGLGAEIAAGRQAFNTGLTGIAETGLAAASLLEGDPGGGDKLSKDKQSLPTMTTQEAAAASFVPSGNKALSLLESQQRVKFAPQFATFKPLIPRGNGKQ